MEIDVLRGCTQRFQNHDCTMTFLTNAGAIVPVINSCLLHLQGSRGPSQVRHSHFPKETGHGAGAYLTIGRHACADESVTWQDMDAAAAYLQEILGFVCGELLKTDFQYGTWPPALETWDNHILLPQNQFLLQLSGADSQWAALKNISTSSANVKHTQAHEGVMPIKFVVARRIILCF